MKQSVSQKSRDIDEETTTLVRSYRIPRKEKESKNILQEIQFDSREYQQDVCPILKQNYYQRGESERNYQYVHCYLVHNLEAANQFENRKKEMKSKYCYTEKDLALTHGFMEARNICKDGLECGNRVFGSLGRPDMGNISGLLIRAVRVILRTIFSGIYLSRHSDMLNAAPSGRIKYVPIVSAHLEPTPGFDCHIAKVVSSELQGASPIKLFESLQPISRADGWSLPPLLNICIYLYEYDDTEIVPNVRHICPMAVITYDYGSPLSRVKEYSVWSGSISCGSSATFTRINLNTAHGKIKPYSL
uniref:Uncharacterized protein n=1 Tax=Romanomermis culicivorax TaxID=13658 RepID=A0A915I4W4_ROMCU